MAECLLIDRDNVERGRVRDQLAGLGLTIVERDDAREGLVYCNDNGPDVVLMALQGASIPTGDFIRRMRRTRQGRRPVVIAYGPQSYAGGIGQAIVDGAAEFLLLPVDCDTIGFKLRQTGIL
jgi:CheY-like chemotaxis protein